MLAVVNIPWVHKERASTSHEGALYAALDVIGQGNPALAQAIHDDRHPPPFSAHLDGGLLRLGCLTTEVFLAVARSKLAYKAEREKLSSCADILKQARHSRTVKMTFATPTSFANSGRTRQHVLPDASRVFGNLVRRWRAAGGEEVPDLRYQEVTVIDARIATCRVALKKYRVYGFVGHALYEVPEDLACWYHTLAEFATYAGVGQRTSQGFGRVKYEQHAISIARQDKAVLEAHS